MKRNNHNINDRMKMARSLCCLMLFFMAGSLMAQSDRQYVIVKGDHYLSHEGNAPHDASSFSTNCIWYSPNNYNYYFMVGTTRKYLKAPLSLGGAISVADNPGTQTLNNNTLDYFFYDWDHGLARGIQHFGGTCPPAYNSSGSQCWQVVWLSYEDNQWKMSSVYGYEPTENSARFLRVTETEHAVAVSGESGGVGNLSSFSMNYGEHQALNGTATPYTYTTTPAYTHYHIDGLVDPDHSTNIPERNYYYYNNLYNTSAPNSTTYTDLEPSGYAWNISCDGNHLSFAENSNVFTANVAIPTLYYRTPNNSTSHKTATLTLTVTYANGATQTRTATVLVRTQCQNPTVLDDDKVITYVGVTVSWLPTAESYEVSWKKDGDTWSSITVGDVTSYTITGLDYNTDYLYKVSAICGGTVQSGATEYTFKTLKEPGLMVNGAIFGGGRMADVGGKTEVVIVNCDSIGAIYGGNDIAGTVEDGNGSTIVLGVNAGGTYASYGTTPNNGKIRVTSVYGGGNGYYAYNGTSFVAADDSYTSETVAVGGHVNEMTQSHHVGDVVWTNTGTNPKTLNFPSIVKTAITVTNDKVKVDSIFGGAKNAFLTYDDYNYDGSLITVDGGTILAVFGGNNFGGDQGKGKQHIVVNRTTTDVEHNSIVNSATHGYGRDFGIRYLFGGGNKVYGSTTNVEIFGGQCDTIFAGGNSADVYAANMTVDCAIGTGSGTTYGHVYSNAIASYDGTIKIKDDYGWDGFAGIYNVRTLFGGNNMATFDSKLNGKVPTITLTSGSIGTVYGGGNAGDMWGLSNDNGSGGSLVINEDVVKYGTHVKMNSPTILIDNLYGGCQVSNVLYSTWVELMDGHVGTVYGGCNVSGDVGSTLVNPNAPVIPVTLDDQKVFGGTYVVASGGIVYKNLFAGGNGYYHCLNDAGCYISGLDYGDPEHKYIGLSSPTHNEAHVVVNSGASVKGSVYAGGNLARVGFTSNSVGNNPYPQMVGLSSVRMNGGTVNGSVYGGGNMADVNGSCEVQVSGGTIGKSLYGGNDRLGKVAVPYSNRILPESYWTASDDKTSLLDPNKVYTYVGLTGNPSITNVYGGGNGDYEYFTSFGEAQAYINGGGVKETVVTCDVTNQPIQQCTFVDIGVDGGTSGAHIGTVYGGGDGVTVTGFVKVFFNVKTDPIGYSNVGTIFGGNNKGDLAVPAEIILLNGQVNTVYGGCNEGAMTATGTTIGEYGNVGSYVRLIDSYDPDGEGTTYSAGPTNYKIMDAVYGGCRMNGVTNNSLVYVEGGDFSMSPLHGLFGGSDISGHVSGFSRVAVVGGTVGNVYGGGNGYYTYSEGNVYTIPTSGSPQLVATGVTTAPTCANSGADIYGGYVGTDATHTGNVFGGGYGHLTSTTGNVLVNVGRVNAASEAATPLIYGDIYGGSALGSVNTNTDNTTTVNYLNGTIHGNVYGGGLGAATLNSNGYINEVITEATVNGTVHVNIGDDDETTYSNYLNIDGSVFGGNNLAGTPKGNVFVDVYRTAHTSANAYPNSLPDPLTNDFFELDTRYALGQVYGGGNLAHYVPTLENAATYVHVHNCDNTIQYVYGGGNAANVPESNVIIDGGLIKYVFGGGNGAGTGNPGANVSGDNTIALNGGVMGYVFGGSNTRGMVYGETSLQFAETPNCSPRSVNELYGGGNQATDENGITLNVPCGTAGVKTIYGGAKNADVGTETNPANIVLNVYGGDSNLESVFGGNNVGGTIWGGVTVNLYGGMMDKVFGGNNAGGHIKNAIQVNMEEIGGDCALGVNTIYGGGNDAAYSPTDASAISPEVNIKHGTVNNAVYGGGKGSAAVVTALPKVTIGDNNPNHAVLIGANLNGTTTPGEGNVYGGGDAAAVTGNTQVNIVSGEVTHKVVGGGNAAGISGNTEVNISGGTVCTALTDAGVYGGCNMSGTVGGNATLNITGSETSHTIIGTMAALENETPVNVHGGGYGAATLVSGNVTVNYGTDEVGGTHCEYPMLYGDMYGGSALGVVNTNADNNTTLNILNGSVKTKINILNNGETITQFGGSIYGGGLGRKAVGQVGDPGYVSPIAAVVNGVVHVNIGKQITPPSAPGAGDQVLIGQASLVDCNVFGCNNANGSPQQDVYVDVYQTTHTPTDLASYVDEITRTYAIQYVFGGGNQADYHPESNSGFEKKLHNTIHYCENTVEIVFGGGNAADADGVVVTVDGGRFDFVFGGGNGEVTPANIGEGSVTVFLYGGHIGWYFQGCNLQGLVGGTPYEIQGGGYCNVFEVENYYFGANEATIYSGLENTIQCGDEMNFKYVYAGSRLAVIYGDVKLTVRGGNIQNLFGGSEGSRNISADVRKYPDDEAGIALLPAAHQAGVREHLEQHPEDYGKGGNIILLLEGGKLGNVYGGNDFRGNVEGNITIIVDSTEVHPCELDINYIYGGSKWAEYAPVRAVGESPLIELRNGHVNGAIFGGSQGGNPGHIYGNGHVVGNPKVVVGDDNPAHKAKVGGVLWGTNPPVQGEGAVYGGGNDANLDGNTTVILKGKTTIEGNVYGGARYGTVAGNTNVIIVPIPEP